MNDIINTVLCIDIINRCVYEDTCKDGDSDAYKCVYVIVQSRQKEKKCAPLTQKETAHAYRSVV